MRALLRIVPLLLALGLVGCSRSKPPAPQPLPAPQPSPPFTLHPEPTSVQLEQGGKAWLRVRVSRNDYQGRIGVELRDLPPFVKCGEAVIAEGNNTADVELTADDNAPLADLGLRAVGTALEDPGRYVAQANFRVTVTEMKLFDLKVEPATLGLAPGGQARVKVMAARKRYDGPIAVELKLPARVSASRALIAEGRNAIDIDVEAEKDAPLAGPVAVRVVGTATQADNKQVLSEFRLHVRRPFELHINPAEVKLEQGTQVKLKLTAVRHDYQGPIELQIRGLPDRIAAHMSRRLTSRGEEEIEVAAQDNAPLGGPTRIVVHGTPSDSAGPPATVAFTLEIVRPVPFTLSVEPREVTLEQGGRAKVKVKAERKRYDGPIAVELLNLPPGVDAGKASIVRGQREAEVTLAADADARIDVRTNLAAQGTATEGTSRTEFSPSFTLRVQKKPRPFELTVEPSVARLPQGKSTRLTVTATRHGYDGPIHVKVQNLPAQVTAQPGVILKGDKTVAIDLNAGPEALVGDKKDVFVLGTRSGGDGPDIYSQKFTVRVEAAAAPVSFELSVDPKPLKVTAGDKARLTVTAKRRGYDGPINLEVRHLPSGVEAREATIPAKRDAIDVELSAAAGAKPGDKKDVLVIGTATGPNKFQAPSPAFTVTVLPAVVAGPPFELKVAPLYVPVVQGGKNKVRVTAQRGKDYDGPIQLDVVHLPQHVRADPVTLKKGENAVDVEIEAGFKAAVDVKKDVQVKGTGTGAGRTALSPAFTVAVRKAELFDLKVEPATVKVEQGGKVKVKVTAVRKAYEGPIVVDLDNLPNGVKVAKATIDKGKNVVELEIEAGPKAAVAKESNVVATGVATMAGNDKVLSPKITVVIEKKK